MKKAIVVGASSGIGKALAIVLAKHGYEVGLMARRTELLENVKNEILTKSYVGQIDLSKVPDAIEKLRKMIQMMQGVDLIVLNSGIRFLNPELDWSKEEQTVTVNVYGFCALAGEVYKYFRKQGGGHLVGISSVAALRGHAIAPAYNASKAFMSNYLEGLRKKAFEENAPIIITDIKPGFVDTAMIKKDDKLWVATPQQAAEQIYSAIQKRKKHAYITHRWRLIGWLLKLMPNWLYQRIG